MSDAYPAADIARAEVERRQQLRQGVQLDLRGPAALEIIADELTLMRAEMNIIRNLLAGIAVRK